MTKKQNHTGSKIRYTRDPNKGLQGAGSVSPTYGAAATGDASPETASQTFIERLAANLKDRAEKIRPTKPIAAVILGTLSTNDVLGFLEESDPDDEIMEHLTEEIKRLVNEIKAEASSQNVFFAGPEAIAEMKKAYEAARNTPAAQAPAEQLAAKM